MKCSICDKEEKGYGNNAYPINSGRCCDECNWKVVIPRRMLFLKNEKCYLYLKDPPHEKDNYYCCCMQCDEIIPLEDGETPEEQEKWYNEEDELKLCADCEEKQ